MENFEYNLQPVDSKKKAGLSFKELWNMAFSNVKLMGKQQVFMIIAFIATAIMLVVAAADFYSTRTIDKGSFVTDDSHYVTIKALRTTGYVGTEQYTGAFVQVLKELEDNGLSKGVYQIPSATCLINIDFFAQLKNSSFAIKDFAYVDKDFLNESDLIYGRMPQNEEEIVIDKEAIDKFCDSVSVLASVISTPEDMLGLTVNVASQRKMTVVGISDCGQMSVYIDKYALYCLGSSDFEISSIDELRSTFPGEYDSIELSDSTVLMNNSFVEGYIDGDANKTLNASGFESAGTYSSAYPYEYVVNEDGYNSMSYKSAGRVKNVKIYTDSPKEVQEYISKFNEVTGEANAIHVYAEYTYGDEIKEYEDARKSGLNTRTIITLTIALISMIILYFTMKSNAIRRTQELVVYRLIGIGPGNILAAYIMELFMITTYTQLPAVILTGGVMKFLSGIETLGFATSCPWYLIFGLMAVIYLANIIIGLIPIFEIVKLPPATLAAKN